MAEQEAWNGFKGRLWKEEINVRDFIQNNYTPYDGDEKFLAGPTEATSKLFDKLQELQKAEHNKKSIGKDGKERIGVLDMDTDVVTGLTAHPAGYIDPALKDLEQVVGLQTDKPLKRAFMPFGGIKMAEQSCEQYGYTPNPELHKIFTVYHKTHSDAVFDVYTPEIRAVRNSHILTGLPDTYGRGRIVGDYRRVALYGIDALIKAKEEDKANIGDGTMTEEVIRLKEEVAEQIKALKGLKEMAKIYGFDISKPATTAKEAVQWLYFGYLGAIKTQNGAAMSIGRVSTFLDIYIERDLKAGKITFSGDPIWATLEVGGLGQDGRSMVTKNDYRFLHTLENMGPSPEPNMTILYSKRLPESFRRYCAHISIETSSVQYENDDVMRPVWGDDYSICCCVSATQTGKEMQFFGARANLAKALLYAINGGRDEKGGLAEGKQVGPAYQPITADVLDASNYEEVKAKYVKMLEWLADIYVNSLNAIHYMHDKYYYEAEELALEDTDVKRTFATGIAGFSHVVDSLSAIKYAKVKVIRGDVEVKQKDKKTGEIKVVEVAKNQAIDYVVEGDFPRYGQDDDRADEIAVWLLRTFMGMIRKHPTYRNAEPSTSILTITSNVVYGKATGALPDGRKAHEPFSPGANPSYGAETKGLVKSLNSVAKLPYEQALDGISNTQTINPSALGHDKAERVENLVNVLDGYFDVGPESGHAGAHHLNVNVFGVEKLKDCQAHPEKPEYANFTVRVSGYAVRFINLTKEQQDDVIARTCHAAL